MPNAELIRLLDATLPQTQCGLCGHPAGCLPYATAMAHGEPANACVPGGQPVADQLASILGREPLPAAASQWPIAADGRPQRMKAVIREDDCIGCTKCITACPVDAIIGSGKQMHSILSDLCTGCELCIPPCPVDCIELINDPAPLPDAEQRLHEQNDLRLRYQRHILREQQHKLIKAARKPVVAAQISTEQAASITGLAVEQLVAPTAAAPKRKPDASTTIKLASLRSQIKKLERQLQVQPDDVNKLNQLTALQNELQALTENL